MHLSLLVYTVYKEKMMNDSVTQQLRKTIPNMSGNVLLEQPLGCVDLVMEKTP